MIDKTIQLVNLERIWPEIPVKSFDNRIIIRNIYKEPIFKNKYEYEVKYDLTLGFVAIHLIYPIISPGAAIHLNSDSTLCLFDRKAYSLKKRFLLGSEIITWTHQWINLYELYLVNGNVWKGEEAPH